MINNSKIQVSVIIPTWNRERSLKKAIQSVLNQSLTSLEIIVSDDGSTDDSYHIVQKFNNPRIKWIARNHIGLPGVVRNSAIKESKGEWIAFLDSDDEWFPEKLEKQLALAKKTKSLAICSNAYSLKPNGDRKRYLHFGRNTISFLDLLHVNYVICSSAVIHRSLLSKCFGFPETSALKTGQDYAFWLRISTQTNFIYLSEPLVLYFDDPSNSNRKYTTNTHIQKIIILENFVLWGLKKKISFNYLQLALYCYLNSIKNLISSLVPF